MFNRIYKTYFPFFLMIVFFCCIVFSSPDNYAQGIGKITDKIGGSGSSTGQTGDTGNNSSTLIIVGAAVIAGFLVYKLVLDKDKPIKDTTKTSSSGESLLTDHINNGIIHAESEFEKIQHQPVNLYLSVQTSDIMTPAKKYIVGIVYNF